MAAALDPWWVEHSTFLESAPGMGPEDLAVVLGTGCAAYLAAPECLAAAQAWTEGHEALMASPPGSPPQPFRDTVMWHPHLEDDVEDRYVLLSDAISRFRNLYIF